MKPKTKRVAHENKPVAVFDYAIINSALEKLLDLAGTEVSQKAIERDVGRGNYLKIREIISFTSNQDAWLNDSSLSSAADKVSGKLSQHYPLLSSLAVFRIISQATYGWR